MLTLRISLLRSATAPDPHQDEGAHDFSFAIIPHRHRFLESGALDRARAFNNPVSERFRVGATAAKLLKDKAVYCSHESSIVLDAVKRAEDEAVHGGKCVVLRLYESRGGRAVTELTM
jgi:alpha-mannosidase